MIARCCLALLMVTLSLTLATAQPKIAPGDMAGRERERFIDSPSDRFMKPGPYVAPPVVETAPAKKTGKRRARRAHPN